MPIKFPGSTTAPAAAKPVAPAPTQADRDQQYIAEQDAKRRQAQAPPAPAAAKPPARGASYYPDQSVGEAPEPSAGGGRMPNADQFGDLRAGTHKFLCAVNSILHWENGPVVTFRVQVGEERGREIKWEQMPAPQVLVSEARHTGWKRDLFSAYAAGGWTHDAAEDRGWGGWPRDRAGSLIPPYIDFFVTDVDGASVPVLVEVTVKVDARRDGGVFWPVVKSVRQHRVDGRLVQAPVPHKLTPWIAEVRGWTGTLETINVKATDRRNAYAVDCVKLAWDQIPLGTGGLLTIKDIRS